MPSEKKKIKLLFSSLLGLKVVTTQSVLTPKRGHTLVDHELAFLLTIPLFGLDESSLQVELVLEHVSIC